MKETLRMKPFQEATVQRVAISPYTSKDSLRIPTGIVLSFPNLRYNIDPDSTLLNDASTFNGNRWLSHRAGFDTSKFQFASTAGDVFDWSGGLHAWPGRFMADVTIKLILICLVTRYEMKLPEGGKERPTESRRFMDLTPDTSMEILVKSLQGQVS
ncbi:cytochrome P450 [Camillea tinctor]|nr:cytochrome P450 [Camillea tinctor]